MSNAMLITSAANPRIQRVRALLDKRKEREKQQAFVVEGVRLAEEALAAKWQPDMALFTAELSERGQVALNGLAHAGAEIIEIPASLMDSVAGTENPQGLAVVFRLRSLPLPTELDFVLVADALRDPGNLGTLLRTAAAAGAQAALLAPGTTDAFAPKVMRAGMGAHFRMPVLPMTWAAIGAACREQSQPLEVLLAEAGEGVPCWDLDLTRPLALIVGGEAEGASPEASELAGQPVTIPMPGNSESLNAAVAASILLFEVVRQRRTR